MAAYSSLWERISANTAEPPNEQACWAWTGKRDRRGYGRMNVWVPQLGQVKTVMVHVAAWVLLHEAPEPGSGAFWDAYQAHRARGLELDHLCDCECCWRPDHFELVTPAVNQARRGMRARNLTVP